MKIVFIKNKNTLRKFDLASLKSIIAEIFFFSVYLFMYCFQSWAKFNALKYMGSLEILEVLTKCLDHIAYVPTCPGENEIQRQVSWGKYSNFKQVKEKINLSKCATYC